MSLKSVLPSLLFLFISFSSCSRFTEMQIQGNWIAAEVLQNNLPMENLPKEEIQLTFDNGKYEYNGTLKYKEAGHYSISTPYLYTTDTLKGKNEEKVVEILNLASDSLELRMMQGEDELILVMVRPGK